MAYTKLPGQLDPSLDLFGGEAATPEWSRNQRLLFIEGEFLQDAMVRVSQLRSPGAIRHISGGLIQRHLMMDTSRLFIRRKCLDQQGELNPYLASELDVHLNAFYLNLSGGLDNLAWAVAYEQTMLPRVDENDQDCRRFCLLTGSRFLTALREIDQQAASVLASQSDWVVEIKELRDPAAHRLPLRIVTGILTEDQRQEYERLQAEIEAAVERRDLEGRRELRHRQSQLLNFMPLLASPPPTADGVRVIPNVVNADQEQFLAVARFVLDHVLARGAA